MSPVSRVSRASKAHLANLRVAGLGVLTTILVLLTTGLSGCGPGDGQSGLDLALDNTARLAAIPASAAKITPAQDPMPPTLHSSERLPPQPLEGPIDTAGAEDSPYVTPDGAEFYFFFTPDLNIPLQSQVTDGVTGIWVSRRDPETGGWSDPVRVALGASTCLDGCEVVWGDTMWFGSVRVGNIGEIDIYTARRTGGSGSGPAAAAWGDIRNAGQELNKTYDIGEFHITADGDTLYFDSDRPGGFGGKDIWVMRRQGNAWSEPENIGPGVNTAAFEGQPFVTADGNELWFTGMDRAGYGGTAVFRSVRSEDGTWGPAEVIVSGFAGEPCLDARGNLYFVHHLWRGDKIIEADIYVSAPK